MQIIMNYYKCHYHRRHRLSSIFHALHVSDFLPNSFNTWEGDVDELTKVDKQQWYRHPCHFGLKLKQIFYGRMLFLSPTTSLLALWKTWSLGTIITSVAMLMIMNICKLCCL